MLFGIAVIAAFLVEFEKTVERNDRATRPKRQPVVIPGRARGPEVDGNLVEHGGGHLARHGPFPNQIVEFELVRIQTGESLGQPADIGRADRLVGFLGVLRLARIRPGAFGHVIGSIGRSDMAAGLIDGLSGHLNAVGPHIGDQADGLAADVDAFIEALGDLHGLAGGEMQFAGRFLLKRRGGERRRRISAGLPALDPGDGEIRGLDGGDRPVCRGFVAQRQSVQLLTVEMGQLGGDRSAVLIGKDRVHRPIFPGHEVLNPGFALANQPQRNRLDTARGPAARQLAPKNRRQGEADEVVQGAAGQVGLDQLLVHVPRVVERIEDGALGDLVEDHPFDLDAIQGLLLVQDLLDVPRDRLALAVGVGGQIKVIRLFDGLGDFLHLLLGVGTDLPLHGEVGTGIHRSVLGRQIANMAVAGEDRVVAPQIPIDRLRLGGRFDNDDVRHLASVISRRVVKPGCQGAVRFSRPTPIPGG